MLGSTKRLAEQFTAGYATECGLHYISVRFGNVLGSRGSMMHIFNAQIARGGPITVTHPDVTRNSMTIPEACELVIQAGALGAGGEAMVHDTGEPIRILDFAKRMIELSGASGIDIVFFGLLHGEKLHEFQFGKDEDAKSTAHSLIRRVAVTAVSPDTLVPPAFVDEH